MILSTIARRPALVVALVAVAAALSLIPASRLRLSADIAEMLPTGSRAAADYRIFLERFGGLEKVFLLVLPDAAGKADEVDLVHAAGLLEEILATSDEVRGARAGFGEADEEFLLRWVAPRAPLLLGGDWLGAVERRIEPAAIRARAARLRALVSTPSGATEVTLATSDPLGFSEELAGSATPTSVPLHLLTSTFLAPDGDAALLVLTPARAEMDPEGGRELLAALEAAYGKVREQLGIDLEFRAVGGPLYAAQDEQLLRQDLRRTLAGSITGAAAILVAAFEGILIPLAALAPLFVALLWTAAWLGLFHSEITAVSIGFAAVLVGLGLDYGIHGAARFRQAFLRLGDAARALTDTARHAGPGIVTSALTTVVAFATLSLAHFRPLGELGLLVAIGILAILAAMALLGSASLVLLARRLRRPRAFWRWLGAAVDAMAGFAARRPVWVLACAAGLSALALSGLARLSVDVDLRSLRPTDHPVYEAEALLVDRFGLGLDTATVVAHGPDLPRALADAAEAARLLRRELGAEAEVTSPADFLALGEPVEERLRQLAALPLGRTADDLERELEALNLDPRAFARGLDALRALGRGEDPGAPPPESWPDWLAQSLTSDEGGTWAAVSLRLPGNRWPAGPPAEMVERIRSQVPGSAIASAVALGPELRALATRDLRNLSLFALAAVAAVVLISFRGRLRASSLAVLPVVLGSLWTLGLWSGLGRSLDLFTLAVLPIMLGIGIDDGLHVMHGARRSPEGGIHGAVRGAGRALVLTTLTTCVGFGSLLLSHIPGLRSGGLLIASGVMVCLLATVLVLPAIEAVARRRR